MKTRAYLLLTISLFLFLVALIPVFIWNSDANIVPPEFGVTASLYVETESAKNTQDYIAESSATSVIITIPFDEDPLPGDPDYTPPASGYNPNGRLVLVNDIAPNNELRGSSNVALEIYSCPADEYSTGEQLAERESFNVRGRAYDENNVLYLLISDDPVNGQAWVRVPNLGELILTGDYNNVPQIACREAPLDDQPQISNVLTTPDSANGNVESPPIPQAITATNVSTVPVTITIDSEIAREQVAEFVPELDSPEVTITEDEIRITGFIDISIIGGITIQGDVEILGNLVPSLSELGKNKLEIDVISLIVAGQDYTDREEELRVEIVVNNWLQTLLREREVVDFTQTEDLIEINAVEPPGFSEAEPTMTGTMPAISPTVTPDLVYSTATIDPNTELLTLTPLPRRTATPGDSTTNLPQRTLDPNAPTTTFEPEIDEVDPTTGELQIDDMAATAHALENLAIIMNPHIAFVEDTMLVLGEARVQTELGTIVQPIQLSGDLIVGEDQTPLFEVTELSISGLTLPISNYQFLNEAINAWLPLLVGDQVSALTIQDGLLNVVPSEESGPQ